MTDFRSGGFDYLPASEAFLEPDRADADRPQEARAVVIPFGLEASVSYGTGTAAGPAAILAASHQLELFDEELWLSRISISDRHVASACDRSRSGSPKARRNRGVVLKQNRFPLSLAGSIRSRRRHPSLRRGLPGSGGAPVRCPCRPADGYLGDIFPRLGHAPGARS